MMVAHAIPPARCNHQSQYQKIAACTSYEPVGISAGSCRTYRCRDQRMRLRRRQTARSAGLPHSGSSRLRCKGILRKRKGLGTRKKVSLETNPQDSRKCFERPDGQGLVSTRSGELGPHERWASPKRQRVTDCHLKELLFFSSSA
jgi:hypothetical protein